MRKKLLITGGSGFVGQNVVHLIKKLGLPFEIYSLSKTLLTIDGIHHISCADAANFDFRVITEQFDYIIHTLALSNEAYCQDFEYAQKVNIGFTKKLLEFCKTQKNLKKIIHISSIIVYDNLSQSPIQEETKLFLHYSNYGFTKGISEYYVEHYRRKYELPVIIFRLANIYGPYQNFINSPFLVPSKIVQGIDEGKIEVFNLVPRRDWIYAEDAASAIVKALDSSSTGIFNLGSGVGVSISEIVQEIASQLGVSYTSLDKPTTGPNDFCCDMNKTYNALNWEAKTTLKEGISRTIEYIKQNKNI